MIKPSATPSNYSVFFWEKIIDNEKEDLINFPINTYAWSTIPLLRLL